MNKQTFTPGPWEFKRNKEENQLIGFSVFNKAGDTVVHFEPDQYGYGNEAEVEANARLIAAAPELLNESKDNITFLLAIASKLEQWADESVRGGWSTHQVDPMRNLAKTIRFDLSNQTAIAKATGEKGVQS